MSQYDYPAPSAFDEDAEYEKLRRREELLNRHMPDRDKPFPAAPADGRTVLRRVRGEGVAWADEPPAPPPEPPAPPLAPGVPTPGTPAAPAPAQPPAAPAQTRGLGMSPAQAAAFFRAHPEYAESGPDSWRSAPARSPVRAADMALRMDLSPALRRAYAERVAQDERRQFDLAMQALLNEGALDVANANGESQRAVHELRNKGALDVANANGESQRAVQKLRNAGALGVANANGESQRAVQKLRNEAQIEMNKRDNDARISVAETEADRALALGGGSVAVPLYDENGKFIGVERSDPPERKYAPKASEAQRLDGLPAEVIAAFGMSRDVQAGMAELRKDPNADTPQARLARIYLEELRRRTGTDGAAGGGAAASAGGATVY